MYKKILYGIMLSAASICSADAQQVWMADNGNGTFTNPLMWGDWPDPDIIRVGDDFYLVSTSMHLVPGCPIATSKDLVNWKMAGYAVERYDEDPRYDLQGGSLYLNGAWASSIRHHNGKFYVAFCTPYGWGRDTGHFSVCEAEHPEGPWQRTILPEYMYDPGLFFDDDGKVYVVHGQHKLFITELNADVKSVKGNPVEIWDKSFTDSHTFGHHFGMEGSHMYKVNGMYYITCPASGTEGWQVCLRSRHIYGPYEHKVIVEDASSYPPNGLHQGGMVQLKNGDWWFVIMQDRGPIGRVPCLLPVKWVDGWPMLGDNGKDLITYPKPAVGKKQQPLTAPATTDEFNSRKLGLQWQWNHNPDNSKWSLSARKGYMRLRASAAGNLKEARNTLTQRIQGPACEGTVALELQGLKDGNVAGFGIFQIPYAYVAVEQERVQRRIVMCNDGKEIEQIEHFTGDSIWIRIRVTDKDFTARFYYSLNGTDFHPIGNVLNMGLGLPWTGNRFSLFNFSTKETGIDGYADFNWFRFTNK